MIKLPAQKSQLHTVNVFGGVRLELFWG